MVFDPRTEDTLVMVRTNLFSAVISNMLSKESEMLSGFTVKRAVRMISS